MTTVVSPNHVPCHTNSYSVSIDKLMTNIMWTVGDFVTAIAKHKYHAEAARSNLTLLMYQYESDITIFSAYHSDSCVAAHTIITDPV